MKLILPLIAILIVQCTSVPKREIAVASQSSKTDPTFADLMEIIRSDDPTTVADFLDGVHQRFPHFFRGYVLAYKSQSIQEGSFKDPRAIVFGKYGRMILTFNGDPAQRSYGSVETLEFDLENGPQLRAIEFKAEPNNYAFSADEIDSDLSNKKVYVTKANSQTCRTCHGQQITHVNWHEYFVWPGFYGSDDDNAFRNAPSLSRAFAWTIPNDLEKDGLAAFRPKLTGHERYKVLAHLNSEISYPRFIDPDSYSIDKPNFWQTRELETRPNLALTSHLFQNTGTYYANRILKDPNFRKYRFVVAAAVLCNDDLNKVDALLKRFLPRRLYEAHISASGGLDRLSAAFIDETKQMESIELSNIKEVLGDTFSIKQFGSGFPIRPFIAAYTILGKPWGFDPKAHSPNIHLVPAFNTGDPYAGFEVGVLLRISTVLIEEDRYDQKTLTKRVEALTASNDYRPHNEICTRLARDSRFALTGVSLP